jgi:hypothetical protein
MHCFLYSSKRIYVQFGSSANKLLEFDKGKLSHPINIQERQQHRNHKTLPPGDNPSSSPITLAIPTQLIPHHPHKIPFPTIIHHHLPYHPINLKQPNLTPHRLRIHHLGP